MIDRGTYEKLAGSRALQVTLAAWLLIVMYELNQIANSVGVVAVAAVLSLVVAVGLIARRSGSPAADAPAAVEPAPAKVSVRNRGHRAASREQATQASEVERLTLELDRTRAELAAEREVVAACVDAGIQRLL